jgi:hypothetical protein
MSAFFALVAPAAFNPIMFFMTAFCTDYANLISFGFEMLPTSFLAIKMGRKCKYIHLSDLFNYLKDNKLNQIMSVYGYSINFFLYIVFLKIIRLLIELIMFPDLICLATDIDCNI